MVKACISGSKAGSAKRLLQGRTTQIATRTLQHSATYDSVPKRYTLGSAAEVEVLDGFSVEIAALYKRVNYSKAGTTSFIDFQAPAPATITFQFHALVTATR